MHSVSTQYDALLAQPATEFCHLWKVTRRDGKEMRLTDHDVDVTFGGKVWRSDIGFTSSAILISAVNAANQSLQIDLAMSPNGVREQDLRGRLYEDSVCEVMELNWRHPEAGVMQLFKGKFGRAKFTDRFHCTIEVLSLTAIDVPIASEVYSQTCRNALGDSLCKVQIESLAINIVVTEIVNKMDFKVDNLGNKPEDFFAFGQLKWSGGNNTDVPVDVRTTVPDEKLVGLFYPLASPIQVGDTGRLYPGCLKTWSICGSKFANQVNFRGEPLVSNFTA